MWKQYWENIQQVGADPILGNKNKLSNYLEPQNEHMARGPSHSN